MAAPGLYDISVIRWPTHDEPSRQDFLMNVLWRSYAALAKYGKQTPRQISVETTP